MASPIGYTSMSLLPFPGIQGGYGGKACLGAVREIGKTIARIEGALKMAGRRMVAMVSGPPDFFSDEVGMAKARSAIWPVVRSAPHIVFGFQTDDPQSIKPALPADWIGKGYRNVVLGTRVDHAGDLPAKLDGLRQVPAYHRMVVISPAVDGCDLADHLAGLDWVVMVGAGADTASAAAMAEICALGKIAFAYFTPEGASGHSAWNEHPFGPDLRLDQSPVLGITDLIGEIHGLCSNYTVTKPVPDALPAGSVTRWENRRASSGSLEGTPEKLPQTGNNTREAPLQTGDSPLKDLDGGLREIVAKLERSPNPCEIEVLQVQSGERDFHSLDAVVRAYLREFVAVGKALVEIRNRELWRHGGFASWAAYCQDVGDVSKNYANRLIVSAEIVTQIAGVVPIGTTLPATESQVRPLARLPDPKMRADAWDTALRAAPDGKPTAALVAGIVAKMAPAKTLRQKSTPHLNEPEAADLARDVAAILDQLQNMAHNHQPHGMIEKAVRKLRRMLRRLVGPEASEQTGKNPDCHIGKDQ